MSTVAAVSLYLQLETFLKKTGTSSAFVRLRFTREVLTMSKFLLRFAIAATMFSLGLGVTNIVRFFRVAPAPAAENRDRQVDVVSLGSDEEKLLEIYREYGPAQTKHDRAFFERVESDRFILFDGNRNLTREQDIREMESWPKDLVFECEVESIRVMGDTAIVVSVMRERSANGEVESFRSTDVCVRDGSSWQILSTTAVD